MKKLLLVRAVGLIGLACALVAVSACGQESRPSAGSSTSPATVSALAARHDAVAEVRPFTRLTGLLGNTLYRMGDAPPRPLTEAVVLGRVSDVQPGVGFRVVGDDAPDGLETDFNDPRALWRTVHVTVDVDSVVSGTVDTDTVTVGFAFDARTPALDEIASDFASFGQIMLFLNRSPVFAYDTSVFGTVMDGALLATVDADGTIHLPALGAEEASQLLTDSATVGALETALQTGRHVVQLDDTGSVADA